MIKNETYIQELKTSLAKASTSLKAKATKRYFPKGIHCIGANACDIKLIIVNFHKQHYKLTANEVLSLSESLLNKADYSEEVMLAFGLINKFVKKNYNDDLLLRFEYWLENYASNWSLVDDLCIKTIYQFLLTRPHLIEQTQHWAYSEVSWCRRASNVVWVKFINRKIGKSTYCLDKKLIFKNCDLLLNDPDEYVQKSIGWLLKVTSVHHENDVIVYIEANFTKMARATIRYAIEKMDSDLRKRLLLLS